MPNILHKINDSLTIFRDDYYPTLGGGNKARKMMALHQKIVSENYDAIVTTGGIQSNHCRATALYCQQNKIDCTLVIHGSEDKFLTQSGNAKIIRQSEAKVIFCDAQSISKEMDNAISNYKINGFNPYYLYGGGHTLEGGKAYIDAISQIKNLDLIPDYIFLASGTGSTQAGILAGISKNNLNTKVVGVSVGRNKERAEYVVQEFYNKLCETYSITTRANNVIVEDAYLCGGYEKYNQNIKKISENSIAQYGICLDTTYTGKAFYGMEQYIKQHAIKGNILFWYTGGIYNYLAK